MQFLKVYNLQFNITYNFKIIITLIIVFSFLRYEIPGTETTISPRVKSKHHPAQLQKMYNSGKSAIHNTYVWEHQGAIKTRRQKEELRQGGRRRKAKNDKKWNEAKWAQK